MNAFQDETNKGATIVARGDDGGIQSCVSWQGRGLYVSEGEVGRRNDDGR